MELDTRSFSIPNTYDRKCNIGKFLDEKLTVHKSHNILFVLSVRKTLKIDFNVPALNTC